MEPNLYIILFVLFIVSGIIINIITKTAYKTGDIAVRSTKSIFNLIIQLFIKILSIIKDIIIIIIYFFEMLYHLLTRK